MVYSTCTTERKENIELINEFLKNNIDFKLMDFSEYVDDNFATAKDGYIEIFPHIHHMDGFFIAKMKRL